MISQPSSRTSEVDAPLVRYRLFMCLAIIAVFALQKFIAVRQPYLLARLLGVDELALIKKWLGITVSCLFIAALVEYAWAFVPRLARRISSRLRFRPPVRSYAFYEFAFYLAASLFLLGDLQGVLLRPYIPAVPSPPLGTAVVWMCVWLVLLGVSSRARGCVDVDLVRFAFLIALTRITIYSYQEFASLYADMLRNIDRCLGLMLAGEFPYIDAPPPAMPYWPLTFLLYLPPKLMGWDFRASNLAVELATVLVALRFGIDRTADPRRTINARLSLPLLMLFRSWTSYSSDTQYPISVLFAVLFARSVASKGGAIQAVVLGAAVAANQTFGAFGLFIFPFWARRFGLRNAGRWTLIALATCLLLIAPFVVWNGKEFFRVTLLALEPFPVSHLAGQFSMRPLVENLFPHAAACLLVLTFVVVGALNWTQSNRSLVAATTAVGYGVFLLLLHRTFSHYYLPVMAMVVCLNYENSADRVTRTAAQQVLGLTSDEHSVL
jgi:hypothetical protein